MEVYQIRENGYLGEILHFPDGDGIPWGYTRTPPPRIPKGYYAKWGYLKWELTKEPPPPEPEPLRIVTKFALINRLTDEEYIKILTASKTDVVVEAWFSKFNLCASIVLNDQDKYFDMFVEKNLLTKERKTQILTNPVLDHERPRE